MTAAAASRVMPSGVAENSAARIAADVRRTVRSPLVTPGGPAAPVKLVPAPRPTLPVKPESSAKSVPAVPTRHLGADRTLSPEELQAERDRIYSRLTSIPNVTTRPSPADHVVFEVADPAAVHRKLVQLGIPSDVVQKYPKVPNGMRVFVRTARRNEEFIRALEQATK